MSEMLRSAGFSECRAWRYWLSRTWDASLQELAVIGLNPSTADESVDDPTIRRCIGYARAWGFGGLRMLNLFAYRATDPRQMKAATHPVGVENNAMLTKFTLQAGMVLAAWGSHGTWHDRDKAVRILLVEQPLYCLGYTKGWQPKHPLYLKSSAVPTLYEPEYHQMRHDELVGIA